MRRCVSTLLAGLAVAAAAAVCSCTQVVDPMTVQPSYVAMETNSGRILYASNCDMRRPVGMLANIGTAVVAIDWIDAHKVPMDTMLTVPASVTLYPRTNLMQLQPGERISLRDALHSTIMWDDSACAATLAHACGMALSSNDPDGAFVAQMNKLATTLGMNATRFKGTHGGVISNSTARDMALLSMYAIERPLFQAISSKRSYLVTIVSPVGAARQARVTNSNLMLAASEGVDGVRAARSTSAGSCLAVSMKRPSVKRLHPLTGKPATYAQRLLVIILGAHTPNERYTMAGNFLRDGWSAWDNWQQSNDFSEPAKFIILPH